MFSGLPNHQEDQQWHSFFQIRKKWGLVAGVDFRLGVELYITAG